MSATPALEPAPPQAGDTNAAVNASVNDVPASTSSAGSPSEAAPLTQDNAKSQPEETALSPEATPGSEAGRSPALDSDHRNAAAARIKQSSLPSALRERLAALVQSSGEAASDGEVRVSLDAAIRAVEESLPDFLQFNHHRAAQPEHPAGEAFFSGDPGELSEAQAEELARTQLARSGLLRGQRAKVAED